MKKNISSFYFFFIIFVIFINSFCFAQDDIGDEDVYNRIRSNGFLTCGVSFSNVLFGEKQGLRGAVGFDMDYCRAMAAAVFGSDIQGRVVFLELGSEERFEVLRNGTADVVVRTTTNTIGRDTVEEVSFSRPTFYDGQGFLISKDHPEILVLDDLDKEEYSLCVAEGSTSLDNAQAQFNNIQIELSADESECAQFVHDGLYTATTSDSTTLIAFSEQGERILTEQISREPLSVVTDERDQFWTAIARWVVNGLVLAESYGVHKQNINSIDVDAAPNELKNILNIPFPEDYVIRSDFMNDVFQVIGVYGDIYSRHIGAAISRFDTLNELWVKNGIQYGEVFSGASESGPIFDEIGTAETPLVDDIRARGFMKCGCKLDSPLFALQNQSTIDDGHRFHDTVGFDSSFCKAVAIAIFCDQPGIQGKIGSLQTQEFVEWVPVTSANRFRKMADKSYDILVRQTTATLGRDMINKASFTRPNFYDGQGVMVLQSNPVKTLVGFDSPFSSYCVASGTTTFFNAQEALSSAKAKTYQDEGLARDAYLRGECDAFTTDKSALADTARDGVDKILPGDLSREPLTLACSDYDVKFFEIVDWVRNGLVIAEHYNITSDFILSLDDPLAENDPKFDELAPEAQRLIGVNGYNQTGLPLHPMFMRYVIAQEGHYGEIYERFLENRIPRAGSLNDLWTREGILYAPPWNGQAKQAGKDSTSPSSTLSISLIFPFFTFLLYCVLSLKNQ